MLFLVVFKEKLLLMQTLSLFVFFRLVTTKRQKRKYGS